MSRQQKHFLMNGKTELNQKIYLYAIQKKKLGKAGYGAILPLAMAILSTVVARAHMTRSPSSSGVE